MKHLLSLLLVAVLALLPSKLMAADKKTVTSINITMPVPQDGMTVQEAEQLQLTAAKTQYGDLSVGLLQSQRGVAQQQGERRDLYARAERRHEEPPLARQLLLPKP